MPSSVPLAQSWEVAPAPVSTADSINLLRDYYVEVSDRYFELHLGRPSTSREIDEGLAATSHDDLASPDGLFLVARLDGEAAGCAGLRFLGSQAAELTRVFVRPAFRGLGGGALLLAAVEDAARARGTARIVLDTRLDLVEARSMYVRHGYAEIPAYNDGPYAEIWYGKELTTD